MNRRLTRLILCILLILGCASGQAAADRLKDLTTIGGVRTNQLVGYGIVVGLAGTGDGSSGLTLQSLQSMVSQFGLVTDAANLTAKNAAAVMVTAEMPAFMKPDSGWMSPFLGGANRCVARAVDDTTSGCRW